MKRHNGPLVQRCTGTRGISGAVQRGKRLASLDWAGWMCFGLTGVLELLMLMPGCQQLAGRNEAHGLKVC